MKNSVDRIRPFRPEDCPVNGKIITWPVSGWTAEIDGKPAAVAGLHRFHGQLWLFFQVLDERARKPHLLHRKAQAFLAHLSGCGEPIYAQRSMKEPTSARWLTRLGFMRTGRKHKEHEVWVWQR